MDASLYNGDSFEILPTIEEKADLILTDIPYNISKGNHFDTMRGNRTGIDFGEWDYGFEAKNLGILQDALTDKGSIVIFHSFEQYAELLEAFDKMTCKARLIWEKTNPMPRNRDYLYVTNIELATWWTKDKWTFNRQNKGYDGCVMKYGAVSGERRIHPTEKRYEMMAELIKRHSNHGDLVLDPFMGSGVVGEACVENGRRFIGIELEKKYFDKAERRINGASEQLSFFL